MREKTILKLFDHSHWLRSVKTMLLDLHRINIGTFCLRLAEKRIYNTIDDVRLFKALHHNINAAQTNPFQNITTIVHHISFVLEGPRNFFYLLLQMCVLGIYNHSHYTLLYNPNYKD